MYLMETYDWMTEELQANRLRVLLCTPVLKQPLSQLY